MTPATLTALAAELRTLAGPDLIAAAQQAAAILEQIAGSDAGCPVVAWQAMGEEGPMHVAAFSEPKVRYGKYSPLIRQTDHLAALTAQSGEGVALYETLKFAEAGLADIGDADREPGDDLAWCEARAAQSLPRVRAAIAAYEAKRGGVR